MDYRIEIDGVLYIPPRGSHALIHEDAHKMCRKLGRDSYRIVSIVVEGVSDSFFLEQDK